MGGGGGGGGCVCLCHSCAWLLACFLLSHSWSNSCWIIILTFRHDFIYKYICVFPCRVVIDLSWSFMIGHSWRSFCWSSLIILEHVALCWVLIGSRGTMWHFHVFRCAYTGSWIGLHKTLPSCSWLIYLCLLHIREIIMLFFGLWWITRYFLIFCYVIICCKCTSWQKLYPYWFLVGYMTLTLRCFLLTHSFIMTSYTIKASVLCWVEIVFMLIPSHYPVFCLDSNWSHTKIVLF